jgi:DNA-binding NarL/FixJ family response regulator
MSVPQDLPGATGCPSVDIEVSVILIDEGTWVLRSLGRWLEQNMPDSEIITIARPAEAPSRVRPGGRATVLLFSIGAARVDEPHVVAALEDLERFLPGVPVILLSDRDDVEEVGRAVLHGVRGFVSMRLDVTQLTAAIRSVAAGGAFVRADTLLKLVQHRPAVAHADSPGNKVSWEALTPREMEVVARLREGKPNKVIAHELEISESTVKAFVRRILVKLNALNRTEVAYLTEGRFANSAATEVGAAELPVDGEDSRPILSRRED